MYLIPCGMILKVGKYVLQLVKNLAFISCVHLASIGKCVLQVELKQMCKCSVLVTVGGLTAHGSGLTGGSGLTAMG